MGLDYKDLFTDWELAVVKRLVRKFKREYECLKKEDEEDLFQECFTHWYRNRGKYDPAKEVPQRAFMVRVIRTRLLEIVRQNKRDKRKISYLSHSLSELEKDFPHLIDKISKDRKTSGKSFQRSNLNADVERILQKLTPQQQLLCHLIGEEELNITEVSEYLGTPRNTVDYALKRLKKILEKEGLKDYLEGL